MGRFLHALNGCGLLPGPEAIQLATSPGWSIHGPAGGLLAGGLFLLPSAGVVLGFSTLCAVRGQLPLLCSLFWGLKAAVLAVVMQAAWKAGHLPPL